MFRIRNVTILLIAVALLAGTMQVIPARAQTPEELQAKIEERNSQIKQLEAEIAAHRKQIEETGKQSKTLNNEIKKLEQTRQKLLADLKLTQAKLSATELQIKKLGSDIESKQKNIEDNTNAVEETLRTMQNNDSFSLAEILLSTSDLSDIFGTFDTLSQLQTGLRDKIVRLKQLRSELAVAKGQSEEQKVKLVAYQNELDDRKSIVEVNKQETSSLLTQTKSKEATFKAQLAEKEALKAALDKEISDFEAQLKLAIDPNSIPSTGKGVLTWPLKNVRITQYFGNTPFATAHPQIYSGGGHNGIDFGAAQGTAILSAAQGVVKGTGNTDTVCPGASYGKWIMVEHPNGLSTLYAHLSLIKVSPGQRVAAGETIGYSGNTGYSTGPHLHFTVYATQGVQIISRKSVACGGTYIMPVADLRAYLNPLSYL